jgi:hypothetical protein
MVTGRGRADDGAEARQIIQKAIDAQGGTHKLGRIKAWTTKVQGSWFAPDQTHQFTGESAVQQPDKFKNVIRLNMGFVETIDVEILDGDKGWTYNRELQGGGQYQPATKAQIEEMKKRAYVDHVASLLPLIQDNKYQLAVLPSMKLGDEEVVGIKITSPSQPEVKLYFSKKTGRLVNREFRLKSLQDDAEHRYEYRLLDYQEVNPTAQDAETIQKAKLSPEPAALLDYLAKLSLDDGERSKIEQLIKQLGDSSFEVREKAKKDLIARGESAVPDLRRALKDPDAEIAGSAKECLREVEKTSDSQVVSAVLRLLADSRPSGVTAALIKYVPSAPNETVRREVEAALAMVGIQEGRADPALTQALKDNDPERRAVAQTLLDPANHTKPTPGRQLLVRGVFQPTREVVYEDGKKSMEWTITELKFFEGLESQAYFRPR